MPAAPHDPAASPPASSGPTPMPIPIIDIAPLLDPATPPPASAAVATAIADALVTTGCVVVRDPRVDEADNARFLDLLQAYFAQSAAAKAADVRPDLHYQVRREREREKKREENVDARERLWRSIPPTPPTPLPPPLVPCSQVGATPEGVETPACLHSPSTAAAVASLPPAARPTWPAGADPKWRFFWRVGPRPPATAFPELNADPVVPAAFTDTWTSVLDAWGAKMVACLDTVARAASAGLGLPPDALPALMRGGPHLLAPTGSDLVAHPDPGTVLAGYHADLNLLTVHGRARYPGLRVWTRDGAPVAVAVPPGCLLLQAGKQLEHVTGGAVAAGWHEVVVTRAAAAEIGRASWRGRV